MMTSLHGICNLVRSQSKFLATPMVTIIGYLPLVAVTSDVIGQFYVRLFFDLELVLVMIRGVLSLGYECD